MLEFGVKLKNSWKNNLPDKNKFPLLSIIQGILDIQIPPLQILLLI